MLFPFHLLGEQKATLATQQFSRRVAADIGACSGISCSLALGNGRLGLEPLLSPPPTPAHSSFIEDGDVPARSASFLIIVFQVMLQLYFS